nr:hypothetical protein [Tanacetum cinerariifolium]
MDKEDQAFGLEEEEDMDLDVDDFEQVEMLTLPSHCVYWLEVPVIKEDKFIDDSMYRYYERDKMDKEDQAFGLEEKEDMDMDVDEDDFEEVHPGVKLSGILNREWAVLPAGNNNEAIPDDATVRTIFSSKWSNFFGGIGSPKSFKDFEYEFSIDSMSKRTVAFILVSFLWMSGIWSVLDSRRGISSDMCSQKFSQSEMGSDTIAKDKNLDK